MNLNSHNNSGLSLVHESGPLPSHWLNHRETSHLVSALSTHGAAIFEKFNLGHWKGFYCLVWATLFMPCIYKPCSLLWLSLSIKIFWILLSLRTGTFRNSKELDFQCVCLPSKVRHFSVLYFRERIISRKSSRNVKLNEVAKFLENNAIHKNPCVHRQEFKMGLKNTSPSSCPGIV